MVAASRSATLRMTHLAGTRRNLWVPCSVVRAPTTWSTSWLSSRYWTNSGIRSFGYVMSASVQTTIFPYASLVPMRRAVPEPPLRRNGISRMLGKRGSASWSTLRVLSVDLSSITSSSYE